MNLSVLKALGIEFQGDPDQAQVCFKNSSKFSKKIGMVLTTDIGGMSLVGIWVRTDSFEVISDEDLVNK